MTSLVLELQRDAIELSISLSNLLRKALIVARKLNIQEFEQWIHLELYGYPEGSKIPEYRCLKGELKLWNPFHGWIPVVFKNYDYEFIKPLFQRNISQPIAELEDLVISDSSMFSISYPQDVKSLLIELLDIDLEPSLRVGRSSIVGILEAIKNIILDWSLKLEEKGILGEGMTFSQKEKEEAATINYQIENLINYVPIGNTMGGTNINQSNSSIGVGINQGEINADKLAGTINSSPQINEILQLIETLRKNVENIPSEHQDVVIESLEILEAEVTNSTKVSRLKTPLIALWSVGKDVANFANAVSAIADRLHIHLPG